MSLSILGMGYANPINKISNKFLEDLDVGTNEEWILDKIGIVTRLTTLPIEYIRETRNEDPSKAPGVATHTSEDLGVIAATMALEKAGIKASDIGLLICNCCTPSQFAPTEGQRIGSRLGINGKAHDVFTACPAFALHMDYLSAFREDELPDYILCISTATLTQCVNYNDRSDGAIWGDGAAAWIVSPRKKGRLRVLDTIYETDPTRSQAVFVDRFMHFGQNGRAVRDFSVRQTVRLVKRLEASHNIDWTRDIFIGHQANFTMLQQITNNRNIPDSNHWHTVEDIGNQAGAGAPAVLAAHWDQIKTGQKIIAAVVGAGLSWGSVLMQAE